MKHLDEHTIELYVLNAQEVGDQVSAIEKHLAECHGCRSLAAELREFHNDLAEEIESTEVGDLRANQSLIPQRTGVEPYFDPFVMPEPYRPTTLIGKFTFMVRRHPIKATVGSFGLASLAMLLLNPNFARRSESQPIADYHAVNYQYIIASSELEVLNKEDEILWKMKLTSAQEAQDAEDRGQHYTQVEDLDGDGTNEIVTTARLVDFKDPGGRHLRIFDGHRNLLKDTLYQSKFEYTGRIYSPFISVGPFVIRESHNPGKKEIFILGYSLGRSPNVLFRLDFTFKIIGEYWHFGNLGSLLFRDIDHDKNEKLLVGGINDTRDSIRESDAALTVIDPARIVGRKRSTTSPGFILEPSDAELYYLTFPKTDMDVFLECNGIVNSIEDDSPSSFITLITSYGPRVRYDFHYVIDDSMRVMCAKSNNPTDNIHQQFVRSGSVKGSINSLYLEKLKDGVRYWDGSDWRRDVVKIKHRPILQ